jgi:hypothetical protein
VRGSKNDSTEKGAPKMSLDENGKVAAKRAKPTLVTVGNRQVISTGRWNDEVMGDFVIDHGQHRWLQIGELARIAYGACRQRCNFLRELPGGPAVVLPINGSVCAIGGLIPSTTSDPSPLGTRGQLSSVRLRIRGGRRFDLNSSHSHKNQSTKTK